MADPISQSVTTSDGNTVKQYANLLGAEIIRTGTFRDSKGRPAVITPKDLEDMVAAAGQVGYTPPLKKGHDDSIGARAWGWVRNLRVAGEKLIGDILDVPESMAAIIRERGYDQISAEVVPDLQRNGKTFPKALWAVAALGAEIPAISGLKPLSELPMFSSDRPDLLIFTSQSGAPMPETSAPPAHTPPPPAPPAPPPPPDPEVARLREAHAAIKATADAQALELAEQKRKFDTQASEIATLQAANREAKLAAKLEAWKGPPAFRPYIEALYRLSVESPRILKFSSEPGKVEDVNLEALVDALGLKLTCDTGWMLNKQLSVVGGRDFSENPGAEVDARVKKMIAADKSMSYKDAMTQVLNADPALKSAYAGD